MSNPLQGGFTPDEDAEEDFSDSGEALEEAETTAAPAATAPAGGRSYTVKPGDSLSKIAKALTGDLNNWKAIHEANRDTIKDPNVIHAGQVLRIPG
jgi:nucleoid-associated protein YgaU